MVWYDTLRDTVYLSRLFSLVLSEQMRMEKERRQKAAELLARLRDKHDADKERARRSYTESRLVLGCFNVVLSEASNLTKYSV